MSVTSDSPPRSPSRRNMPPRWHTGRSVVAVPGGRLQPRRRRGGSGSTRPGPPRRWTRRSRCSGCSRSHEHPPSRADVPPADAGRGERAQSPARGPEPRCAGVTYRSSSQMPCVPVHVENDRNQRAPRRPRRRPRRRGRTPPARGRRGTGHRRAAPPSTDLVQRLLVLRELPDEPEDDGHAGGGGRADAGRWRAAYAAPYARAPQWGP